MLAMRIAELSSTRTRPTRQRYLDDVLRVRRGRAARQPRRYVRSHRANPLHKLMAYKDEYEVARLSLDADRPTSAAGSATRKVTWNLHPPMLRAMGMKQKLKLGRWFRPLGALAV